MTAPRRSASIVLKKSDEYNIGKSMEKIGPLYPVLMSQDGRVIDGIHRLHANKNWPKHIVPITGSKVRVARIVANLQRREVPPKEKTIMLKELAQETHWTPEEISENTGMSISWVRKYLPSEFKDKNMAELASKKHKKEKSKPSGRTFIGHTCHCGTPMILMYVCPNCGDMENK